MDLGDQIGGGISIEQLPLDILFKIMKKLPLTDRCRARRVCKNWNDLLSDSSLWRHVDLLDDPFDLKTMLKIVRTYFSDSLLTLKIRCCTRAVGHEMIASFSNRMLRELTARCPNLYLLQLFECTASEVLFKSLPPSITCLEMVYTIWHPRLMRNKQIHLPNLQHLTLDNSVRVDGYDMEDVAVWKNLKYLSLEGCYMVGTSGVITIADHLSELEFLNLSSTDIDDLAVHYIAQQLNKLKELCLAKCKSVNDGAVAHIAVGLPRLNKLNISFCEHVTMRGLESLFVSKLSVLIVERKASLSEEEKQTLKRGFPKHFVLRA